MIKELFFGFLFVAGLIAFALAQLGFGVIDALARVLGG